MKYYSIVQRAGKGAFYPVIVSKRQKNQKEFPVVKVGQSWKYFQQAQKEGRRLLKMYLKEKKK